MNMQQSDDTQVEQGWLAAREAAHLLGVKSPKFFYHVDRGEIEFEQGDTPKTRKYKIEDILKVKERLQRRQRRPQPVLIDWLQSSDIPAGLTLASSMYSEEVDLAEAAVYQSWRKHNNQLTIAAFNADRSICYASLQVVPLEESIILDILSGRRNESSIKPDEVRAYDEPGPYYLLGTSAVVSKDRPDLLYRLIAAYIDFWIEQFPSRYIKKIYAQTVSERGVMLAQHLFMSPRPDLHYDAFELDLARPSASKIVQNFKKRLQGKAELPPGLSWPPIATEPGAHDDTISLRAFAQEHGVNPRTAIDQARIGTRGERLQAIEKDVPRGQEKWFLSPEQQSQARAFWQAHKTPGYHD